MVISAKQNEVYDNIQRAQVPKELNSKMIQEMRIKYLVINQLIMKIGKKRNWLK